MLRQSRRASEEELLVAGAILRGSGDPRANALLEQLRRPGRVRRSVQGGRLVLKVESTTEDLLVDLDADASSLPVTVRDALSGRELTFVVTLRRGGFFGSLVGSTEGRWPRRWLVDPAAAAVAAESALRLGTGPVAGDWAISRALDLPVEAMKELFLRPAARPDELAAVETREGSRLPEPVRELLGVSDGLFVGDLAILGVQDVYTVDFGDGRRWWLVGQRADGMHFMLGPDGVAAVPEPRADADIREPVASTYLDWVRSAVRAVD